MSTITPMSVVIAGGGVGALEALMALHDLGEGRLRLTLVAPNDDFALRPIAVAVPFSVGHVTHVSLASVCARYGTTLHGAAVASVDPEARTVLCDELALLIAREARESSNDTIAVHLVTPEARPLAIFGAESSDAVRRLLKGAAIILHPGS
jgi:NADH dehydrogenase FAD-containing subunit